MRPSISIVICTFNGARRLPQTIRHIALQKVRDHIEWELILVDNASTDDSALIAQHEWDKHNSSANFSIIHQPQLGLTYAREMGYRHARYNCILLCDDDNWLDENYINVAYEVLAKNPNIGILGGNGEFVYEKEPPPWLVEYRLFAGGPQADQSGKVTTNLLYGAGAILRKSAYETIIRKGYFSLLTDRMASQLTSGGDYELCYALALAGFDIWYDERMQFKHFITRERLTWDYYLRYIKESSDCFEVLEPYKIAFSARKPYALFYNLQMFRSLFYHFRKFIPVLLKRSFIATDTDKGKVQELMFISLKTRLHSYRKLPYMKKNFLHIVAYKKRLEEKPGATKIVAYQLQELQ